MFQPPCSVSDLIVTQLAHACQDAANVTEQELDRETLLDGIRRSLQLSAAALEFQIEGISELALSVVVIQHGEGMLIFCHIHLSEV